MPHFNFRRFAALAAVMLVAVSAHAQLDQDGDGYTDADGDLYDVPGGLVSSPELVNPGAYDIPGNGIDDDCDGTIDNPRGACSTGDQLSGLTGALLAQAMDVCQTTVQSPPTLAQRRWGLINAELRRSLTNAALPDPRQVAVSADFGPGFQPNANGSLAVLSTGTARHLTQPDYFPPGGGFADPTNTALAPASFLAAHGNTLLHRNSCPVTSGSSPVYDMVMLRLRLRVPTNAIGITFDHAFLAAQYPDLCTQFNDHFLALITTVADGIPVDRNIVFDALNNPISIQTAFFGYCTPAGGNACPLGPALLDGTGFDPAGDATTGWLTSVAPVVPGETIVLEFFVFDVGDGYWDSTVLLDNLGWSLLPQAPLTAVDDQPLPGALRPLQAAPNPFNPSTRLTFTLAQGGPVQLAVYDIAGRRIATLSDGPLAAGDHQVNWNGRGDDGQLQPSGVYYARLTGGGRSESTALMLVK